MLISVALCTYNGRRYIQEQIDSILVQTVKPDEVVISDDNSQDGTVEFLKSYVDSIKTIKFLFLENKKNIGVVKNFEKCLAACTGDFIFLCDQDDVWESKKIEFFIQTLNKKNYLPTSVTMAFSNLTVVNETLQPMNISFFNHELEDFKKFQSQALYHLMLQNWIPGCSAAISRGLLQASLPFPEKIHMHDHWLALLALTYGNLEYIDQKLTLYRQHSLNVVGSHSFSVKTLKKKMGDYLSGRKFQRMDEKILQAQRIFERGIERRLLPAQTDSQKYAKSLLNGSLRDLLFLNQKENLKLPSLPLLAYLIVRNRFKRTR